MLQTKEQILQQCTNALGGLENLRQLRGLHIRALLQVGGLQGTREEWVAMDGRRRCQDDLDHGLLQSLTTFNGRRAWRCELDPRPTELAGADLRDETNQVFQTTYSHLVPGRMPGEVDVLNEDSTNGTFVIRILPQGGNPITWYLDKTSFLPVRIEEPEADRTRVTFFENWCTAGGIRFPHVIRQSTGNAQYDILIRIQEVNLNPPLEKVSFDRPPDPPPDWTFTAGITSNVMPFDLCHNLIFLQAKIGDRPDPFWFLLDCGADTTVVNTSVATALELPSKGQFEGRGGGEGSAPTAALVRDLPWHFPDLTLLLRTAGVLPLEPLEFLAGHTIDGILGYEFFNRFIIEIDYASRRLAFHDPSHFTYRGSGVSLPILIQNRTPYLQAQILLPGHPPVEGLFGLDTGGSGALHLNTPFIKKHQLDSGLKTIQAPLGAGIGGDCRGQYTRAAGVTLGPFQIKEPVVGLSSDTGGAFASSDMDGNLGAEILRRFKVVFDYPHRQVILEPNGNFDQPYDINMSGLRLTTEGPEFRRFKVLQVIEPSPGAEARIQAGDYLTAIDGRPAREFTLDQISRSFREAGRKMELTIQRDDRTQTVRLNLRRLI
jgi:hypothetical protein